MVLKTIMRTDDNNNPTAFTTAIAENAGLVFGTDYETGTPFKDGAITFFTAKLLGDPIALTIKVIDTLGFRTKAGFSRWVYINLPKFVWLDLLDEEKLDVIGWMYQQEGGVAMRSLFPNYGEQ